MNTQASEEIATAWMQLFVLIRGQFPYSKMRGLTIKKGAVVSFKEVQYTFILGRGVQPPRCLLPDTFDEQWQRFMRFCQELHEGILGEVHFSDGRPVLVSRQHAGMDLCAQHAQGQPDQGGQASKRKLVNA